MFVGMAVGDDPKGSKCVEVMSNFDNIYCWFLSCTILLYTAGVMPR